MTRHAIEIPFHCDPMDCSPPSSYICGIPQMRLLEWWPFPFLGDFSQLKDWAQVSCITGWFFTSSATMEALSNNQWWLLILVQWTRNKAEINRYAVELPFHVKCAPKGGMKLLWWCFTLTEIISNMKCLIIIKFYMINWYYGISTISRGKQRWWYQSEVWEIPIL